MAWEPDYVTLAEAKAWLRVSDAIDDVEIALDITSASRAIDEHCGRQFGVVSVAEQRLYTAYPDYDRGQWMVDVDDFQSAAGLVVTVAGVALTTFTKEPSNAAPKGRPWTTLAVARDSSVVPVGDPDEIAVTALWGWTAVPVAVKLACKLQLARFAVRRESPYGVAGSPDNGNELRLQARVDADVAVSLRPYRRTRKVR